MENLWFKIKKGLTDGYQNLSHKTEELTQIGRLKLEIIAVKRDIEKAFIELGGRVYQVFQENGEVNQLSDQEINKLVKEIKELETKLHDLEKKVEGIKSQRLD